MDALRVTVLETAHSETATSARRTAKSPRRKREEQRLSNIQQESEDVHNWQLPTPTMMREPSSNVESSMNEPTRDDMDTHTCVQSAPSSCAEPLTRPRDARSTHLQHLCQPSSSTDLHRPHAQHALPSAPHGPGSRSTSLPLPDKSSSAVADAVSQIQNPWPVTSHHHTHRTHALGHDTLRGV